jgi:hypothetical protein
MSLSDSNKAALAFKNTQGKAHTATNKELGNEEEQFRPVVAADGIWLSAIGSTPDFSIMEAVTASLQPDPTSNGTAFFAYYPVGHPKAGQRVYNAVPHSYGNAYEAAITGMGGGRIAEFDARDWVYQYQPGIFFQQTAHATPTPVSAAVYVYKGETLSSSIAAGTLGGGTSVSGSGGATLTPSGSQLAFSSPAGNIIWNNNVTQSLIVPTNTDEINIVVRYGMTGSVASTGTLFALDVPTTGTLVDGDMVIMGKSPDLNNRGHFKLNIFAFNSGSKLNTDAPITMTVPDIKTDPAWDVNLDLIGTSLYVSLTGSVLYNIDWTMHGTFRFA